MRAIGLITLLVFSTFIKPSLAQPHHFRKGVVEKITVTDSNLTRELAEAQVGPTTPGTVYVVTVRSGASVYSGEFRIEHDSDYPSTLRLRQTVRFRAAQVQFTACDIHNVMTLMTLHYLFLRDQRGRDWKLYMSGFPSNFNADITGPFKQ